MDFRSIAPSEILARPAENHLIPYAKSGRGSAGVMGEIFCAVPHYSSTPLLHSFLLFPRSFHNGDDARIAVDPDSIAGLDNRCGNTCTGH